MATRIVHTADVHLRTDAPARREALETVLTRAEATDADVVTIGGDLFDTPEALERLRTELRTELFTDRSFEILLIPGNHDEAAFRGDVFFGDDCTVLRGEPFEHWVAPDGDVRVTGLPYRDRADDDLLLALRDRDPFDGTEVLLLHCSLDAPVEDYETGAEGARQYFPVRADTLAALGFDYYLAGHYHSTHEVAIGDDATFAYPGTPASTSTAETGRRRVAVLNPSAGIRFETLSTFHHADRSFTATPGREPALLDEIDAWVDEHVTPDTEATVTVTGFVDADEAAFHDRLTEAAAPATVTDDTRNVTHVRSRPLYRAFEDELDAMDWDDETTAAVRERTLAAFSDVVASGGR